MKCWMTALKLFGIDLGRVVSSMSAAPRYFRDKRRFEKMDWAQPQPFVRGTPIPCLGDSGMASGVGRGAYFHQDMLVARRIFENVPERHIDVGSRVDGFVAHVASFRDLEVIDIRPLSDDIPHVTFLQADMMDELPPKFFGCCDSLSCLHALEHFGLGRYGDPLMPDGWARGFRNLSAMLRGGGRLYLSVPVGQQQRVNFNGHRVFSLPFLVGLFDGVFDIAEVSVVDDGGNLHRNVDWTGSDVSRNLGLRTGCGIVEAVKKETFL